MDNFLKTQASLHPNSAAAAILRFHNSHGGDASSARHGNWVYYADGAVRELGPLGAMMDPPSDAYERCQNIVIFHQAKLTNAVQDFEDLRQTLVHGTPDREALNE